MNGGVTLETLHTDLQQLRVDIVRLESKIDSKPSLMTMFTGIVIVVFGLFSVMVGTVTALNTLGFLQAVQHTTTIDRSK
jgi:hypothetical protein